MAALVYILNKSKPYILSSERNASGLNKYGSSRFCHQWRHLRKQVPSREAWKAHVLSMRTWHPSTWPLRLYAFKVSQRWPWCRQLTLVQTPLGGWMVGSKGSQGQPLSRIKSTWVKMIFDHLTRDSNNAMQAQRVKHSFITSFQRDIKQYFCPLGHEENIRKRLHLISFTL